MNHNFSLSKNKINEILVTIEKDTEVSFKRPDQNTWIILLDPPIHIVIDGPWVSLTLKLMDDVQGKNEAKFYRELLSLSQKYNGLKIGVEDTIITVTTGHQATETNFKKVVEDIILLHNAYKQNFNTLIQLAHKLGLKFRKSNIPPALE